jgi:hypothetical protein
MPGRHDARGELKALRDAWDAQTKALLADVDGLRARVLAGTTDPNDALLEEAQFEDAIATMRVSVQGGTADH